MYVCLERDTVIALERIVAVVALNGEVLGEEGGAGKDLGGGRPAPAARTALILENGQRILLKAGREAVVRRMTEARIEGTGEKGLGE